MRKQSGNLRQRKVAVNEKGESSQTSERNTSFHDIAIGRRRRKRQRNGDEIHKSWFLAVITISVLLFILINWPRESKDDANSSSRKFHNRLRRNNNSVHVIGEKSSNHHAIHVQKKRMRGVQAQTSNTENNTNTTVQANHEKIFRCADGMSTGILNDDYCDCPDGSDEPRTPACSHLIQTKSFACGDGHTFIYPSRIRDGIKDCPDGSDEWIA
jgi:hypothetical protein